MGVFKYTDTKRATSAHATPKAADAERHPGVNRDPYVADLTLSVELRTSFVADVAMQIDQGLVELSALTRRARMLSQKLLDPKLADDPHRPAAVARSYAQDDEIAEYVQCIVCDEAKADRYWQSLTPSEREHSSCDAVWGVPADQRRLIGVSWHVLAMRHEWPPGWRLKREWVNHLPLWIVFDLRIAKVWTWEPNPYPPSVWDGAQAGQTPAGIARQIADDKGNPR